MPQIALQYTLPRIKQATNEVSEDLLCLCDGLSYIRSLLLISHSFEKIIIHTYSFISY